MNPAAGSIVARRVPIAVGDGAMVQGYAWTARSPTALVAIVHGLGEHAGRYGAVASDLVAAGSTVMAFDWPGHGRSEGPRGDASWSAVRDRVIPAVLRVLRSQVAQALPLTLVGHSMGGAMALDYALTHPATIDAVVASAPGLRAGFRAPRWKLVAARVLRMVAPHVGVPHGLPLAGLSRDAEVIERYASDPLVHGVMSPRLYFGLLDAQARVLADASTLRVPALVLAGTADTIADWTAAREFVAAVPSSLATFVQLEGACHEILNDLDREVVIAHVLRHTAGAMPARAPNADQT